MIIREYYQRGAPDPVLDSDLVLSLARRHVPKAGQLTGVDETGGEARVYYIDNDVVLKVQRPQQLRSWTSLEKEVRFLEEIAKGAPDLPVPRVLGHGRDGRVEYTCMTRMSGDAAVRTPIPPGARAETLRALGRIIWRVHALDQKPLVDSGLFPEEYTAADLRQSVPERLRSLAAHLAERGATWPLALSPDDLCERVAARVPDGLEGVALHTNPGPTHTFVDPSSGRLTGLIDFGDAYIGHPAFDLWQWGDPDGRQAVLAGYVEAGEPPVGFWPVWEAVEAVADLVALVRDRPYQEKATAHLRELVAKW